MAALALNLEFAFLLPVPQQKMHSANTKDIPEPGFGRASHLVSEEEEVGDGDVTARRSLPRELKEPGEKSKFDGDFLIVAAGPVWLPSYEGSDRNIVTPGIAVAGRIKGIGISPRAAGLALDFIKDKPGSNVSFSFGPAFRLRNNRVANTKDPVVEKLGRLGRVIEGGVTAGVTFKRVLNPHDQLNTSFDLRWDLSGRGSGKLAVASVSYLTPLSKAQVLGLSASAEFADQRYARYNYGVSAAGSAASGLPVYSAKGGLKAINVGAFTARDFNGNLLDGGFALAAGVLYSRLAGSAAETPITRLRGKRSQWTAALGLSYTF